MHRTLHQRTRALASLAAAAAFVLTGCAPDGSTAPRIDERPSLITYGSPSGTAHPEVVLILMQEPSGARYRCSGTLITPTIVLTAGHCTGARGEFEKMRIFTESNVQTGNNNYPLGGGLNSVEAIAWHTHPLYTSAQFFLNDVGVIVLAAPVNLPAGSYGVLPGVDVLDGLRRGSRTTFTAVGYGLQRINPVFVEAQRIRMQAEPHLVQINTGFTGSRSLLLSNNASTGGTCFGDSGGPNYIGTSNVVGGVTSFGINGNCAGTGGVFRMDRPDVLAFVQQFLD